MLRNKILKIKKQEILKTTLHNHTKTQHFDGSHIFHMAIKYMVRNDCIFLRNVLIARGLLKLFFGFAVKTCPNWCSFLAHAQESKLFHLGSRQIWDLVTRRVKTRKWSLLVISPRRKNCYFLREPRISWLDGHQILRWIYF